MISHSFATGPGVTLRLKTVMNQTTKMLVRTKATIIGTSAAQLGFEPTAAAGHIHRHANHDNNAIMTTGAPHCFKLRQADASDTMVTSAAKKKTNNADAISSRWSWLPSRASSRGYEDDDDESGEC